MARYHITTPVPGVNSTVAGVTLHHGTATTDSEGAVAYFRRHGYLVEEILEPVDPAPEPETQPVPAPARGRKKESAE